MAEFKSKYKTKSITGNMMYGPGCCAHKRDYQQVVSLKARVAAVRARLPENGKVHPTNAAVM